MTSRRIFACCLVVCASLMTTRVGIAQDRASFAGTWVGVSVAQRLVIAQDAKQLSVTDARGAVLVYQLDGSPSRNQTQTVRGTAWTLVSTAKWVSSALVITTTTTRETGQSWDSMTIYRRSTDGNLHVTMLDAILNSGPHNAMGMYTVEYKSQPGL